MLKFENCEVVGFEHAIRGMRECLNLLEKDDVARPIDDSDYDVLKRFSEGRDKNRDPLSMIFVYVDITAPLYFWSELDKYHNRCIYKETVTDVYFRNVLHKSPDYTPDDFCCEKLAYRHYDQVFDRGIDELASIIDMLNGHLRDLRTGHETSDGKGWYLTHGDWHQVIGLLPLSFMQKRTAVFSYQDLRDIYISSWYVTSEDVGGWHEFRKFIDGLPHSDLISWDTKEKEQRLKEEVWREREERFSRSLRSPERSDIL